MHYFPGYTIECREITNWKKKHWCNQCTSVKAEIYSNFQDVFDQFLNQAADISASNRTGHWLIPPETDAVKSREGLFSLGRTCLQNLLIEITKASEENDDKKISVDFDSDQLADSAKSDYAETPTGPSLFFFLRTRYLDWCIEGSWESGLVNDRVAKSKIE